MIVSFCAIVKIKKHQPQKQSRICFVQKAEIDKDCQTVTGLDCDTEMQAGKKLRCSICTKFKTAIVTRRNFSERWIAGAEPFETAIFETTRGQTNTHTL